MAIVALSAFGLSACDSTQDRNARAKLTAEREIAGREPTRVDKRNPDVDVTDVALVRDGTRSAIVVELRSRADRPLTDVPITVGVRRGSRFVALNEGKDLGWFRAHVPAIPAGGTTTWVYRAPAGRRTKAGDVAFAKVGVPGGSVVSSASSLPRLDAGVEGPVTRRGARVVVENASDVPQFGLQVYAYTRDGKRYVTAGTATVPRLARHASTVVTVPLTGAENGSLRVAAAPTTFE